MISSSINVIMSMEEIKSITEVQSIRTKSFWVGTNKLLTMTENLLKYQHPTLTQSVDDLTYWVPLYKIVDEALVNASDHAIRQRDDKSRGSNRVTEIRLTFDVQSGRVIVFNNGRGIPTGIHPEYGIHAPEILFGRPHSGTNVEKTEEDAKGAHHGTGGVNGIGIYLANVLSDWFTVDIVTDGQKYTQSWSCDGTLLSCGAPSISKTYDKSSTTISMMPAYTTVFKGADMHVMDRLFHSRMIMLASYIYSVEPSCRVIYNDMHIDIKGERGMSELLYGADYVVHSAEIKAPLVDPKGSMKISIAVRQTAGRLVKDMYKSGHFVNINGIFVKDGGSHIDGIIIKIIESKKMEKFWKDNDIDPGLRKAYVAKNMYIFGNMRLGEVDWKGQTKDQAVLTKPYLAAFAIPPRFITDIIPRLTESIASMKLGKESVMVAAALKKNTNRSLYDIAKYESARHAGKARSNECMLMLAEGNSALAPIRTGLELKLDKINRDFCGLYTTGGVIPNVTQITKKAIDPWTATKTTKLKKFTPDLIRILGLDFTKTYETGPIELRYGSIIVCVDQDVDGVGNIFTLIANIFMFYWPALIKRGFIKRFATPVKRVYAGEKLLHEFYSADEYKRWHKNNQAIKHDVVHIKGLGTNGNCDSRRLFTNFAAALFTYTYDAEADQLFRDMYNKDSEPRKRILRPAFVPTPPDVIDDQIKTREIKLSNHVKYDAVEYHKSKIMRNLKGIDGLTESPRKIVNGAILYFAHRSGKPAPKVEQLQAAISESQDYEHGGQAQADSIFGLSRNWPGGSQLPIMIPKGAFGKRAANGKDHAHGRYAHVMLNTPLVEALYGDRYLLDYHFDGQNRIEPVNFVPCVPTMMLEHYTVPATGWSTTVWGRDIMSVIRNVKRRIACLPYEPFELNTYGHKGSVEIIDGVEYSIGCYTRKDKVITITELPLCVWADAYAKQHIFTKDKITKKITIKPMIESYHIDTGDMDTSIEIVLSVPFEEFERTCKTKAGITDPVIAHFGLYNAMRHNNMNFVSPTQQVLEFASFDDICDYWFPIRRDMYEKRITRDLTHMRIKIEMYENIIRNLGVDMGKKINRADLIEYYKNEGYPTFNRALVMNPGHTPTNSMNDVLHAGSYEYLWSITILEKTKKNIDKKTADLTALIEKLIDLEELMFDEFFPGSSIWLSELNALGNLVEKNRPSFWGQQ